MPVEKRSWLPIIALVVSIASFVFCANNYFKTLDRLRRSEAQLEQMRAEDQRRRELERKQVEASAYLSAIPPATSVQGPWLTKEFWDQIEREGRAEELLCPGEPSWKSEAVKVLRQIGDLKRQIEDRKRRNQ